MAALIGITAAFEAARSFNEKAMHRNCELKESLGRFFSNIRQLMQ